MQHTRELARIKATQKACSTGTTAGQPKPLSFSQWFLQGIRNCEDKGAEFELLPGMVKITLPGKTAILTTIEDFEREYKKEYLSKF